MLRQLLVAFLLVFAGAQAAFAGADFENCQVFTKNGDGAVISDADFVESVLYVPATGKITDIDITLNLSHPDVSELSVQLVSPGGAGILLAGGDSLSGANYTGTTFDDEAALSISLGSTPYTGHFIPISELSVLDEESPMGEWTLQVFDNTPGNDGTLTAWSLNVC
jgi:subtilisin-like proprotein convertase family protein